MFQLNRRAVLQTSAIGFASWLTPVAELLGRQEEQASSKGRAKGLIVLWLEGGPSQLDTFDPHPGTNIGGEVKAVQTSAKGIQIASSLQQTADLMHEFSLARAVTSMEGDHVRAIYNIKTGFRPDPTLIHPSIGAILCHQTEAMDKVDIPRHVSILATERSGRGGYLGDQYDAFRTFDPINGVPDLSHRGGQARLKTRLSDLDFVNGQFAKGRLNQPGKGTAVAGITTQNAVKMMSSEQLKAFEVKDSPEALRKEFGDTPFGRGCLAALQLIEVGVRCVEVTLTGWDSHANNFDIQKGLVETLDPALAALIRNLKSRDRLKDTLVVCGGEFGRTPTINPAGGRDHWPHGFTIAMAGGGIGGGRVFGETSPDPKLLKDKPEVDLKQSVPIKDVHATILHCLGVDYGQTMDTPIGRPMKFSEGNIIPELLTS